MKLADNQKIERTFPSSSVAANMYAKLPDNARLTRLLNRCAQLAFPHSCVKPFRPEEHCGEDRPRA